MKCIYCGTRTDVCSPHCTAKLLRDYEALRCVLADVVDPAEYNDLLIMFKQAHEENLEQARLLGMSGEREVRLLAENQRLRTVLERWGELGIGYELEHWIQDRRQVLNEVEDK